MDDDLAFGSEHDPARAGKKASFLPHPQATFFHCCFRFFALFVYLFGGLFVSSFVTKFIFILLLLSADFWTVKNISGRLLVGLRWWNQVDETGKSTWIFESRSQKSLQMNPISMKESTIFWVTLVACPVLWVLLFFSAFATFSWSWLPLVVIAVTLTGANLIGYLRCKFSGTQQISKIANDYLAASMLKKAFTMIPGFGNKQAETSGADAFGTWWTNAFN